MTESKGRTTMRRISNLPLMIAGTMVAMTPAYGRGNLNHLHPYAGTFQLSDGRLLTGGPSYWDSPGLTFTDPLNTRTRFEFEQVEGDHFKLTPGGTVNLRFERDGGGSVTTMHWSSPSETPLIGERFGGVNIRNLTFRSDDAELAGELWTPEGEGPFPAILILHGSGPSTRYYGALTSHYVSMGVAVLTYDKRGCGDSGGRFVHTDYEGFTVDARAAVRFLAQQPEIDTARIGLQGNSESGWFVPEVASSEENISFLVMRACPGTRVLETIMHETDSDLADAGVDDAQRAEIVAFVDSYYKMAVRGESREDATAFVRSRSDQPWFAKALGKIHFSGNTEDQWKHYQKRLGTDPAVGLRKLTIPILWFLGEKDQNVPHDASKSRIIDALTESGNVNYEIITVPKVRHSFILEDPGSPTGLRYGADYWDRIASWMFEQGLTSNDVDLPAALASLRDESR